MYLIEPRLFDVVKKQVRYKFNAYTGVFTSLLILQIIGVLFGFSMAGNSSGSYGAGGALIIKRDHFTGDLPVVFTLIWAFTTGVIMTTKAYRQDIFSLVSNRLSHHLSSGLFLLITSVIAGISMALAGSIIRFSTFFRTETMIVSSNSVFQNPFDFFSVIVTAILYTILLMSIGYLIGSITQRSKVFIVILVIVVFVLPMFQLNLNLENTIATVAQFFGEETSLFIFFVKVIITALLLFAVSIGLTNKLEVHK